MENEGKVYFFFEEIDEFNIDIFRYREWINEIVISEESIPGFLNIILTHDDRIKSINSEFLDHHYYTDIITFNYCEEFGGTISGDLYISIDRVTENANYFGELFDQELTRIIAHGILHLLGYDDDTSDEKEAMKKKENFYIMRFDEKG